MAEFLKRYYLKEKEEEFLEDFPRAVAAAEKVLAGEWHGPIIRLVFDSAAVYHDENGFSSVQIALRSSKRLVTVRVRKQDDEFVAEKIVDRPDDTPRASRKV